jgi:hypothetical protein
VIPKKIGGRSEGLLDAFPQKLTPWALTADEPQDIAVNQKDSSPLDLCLSPLSRE